MSSCDHIHIVGAVSDSKSDCKFFLSEGVESKVKKLVLMHMYIVTVERTALTTSCFYFGDTRQQITHLQYFTISIILGGGGGEGKEEVKIL